MHHQHHHAGQKGKEEEEKEGEREVGWRRRVGPEKRMRARAFCVCECVRESQRKVEEGALRSFGVAGCPERARERRRKRGAELLCVEQENSVLPSAESRIIVNGISLPKTFGSEIDKIFRLFCSPAMVSI